VKRVARPWRSKLLLKELEHLEARLPAAERYDVSILRAEPGLPS